MLLNAGIQYESAKWKIGIEGRNLTDERYFRSNFPGLFGSSVVLPQLPRGLARLRQSGSPPRRRGPEQRLPSKSKSSS
jgi:outer membrane receptor protein involved in Fe transport